MVMPELAPSAAVDVTQLAVDRDHAVARRGLGAQQVGAEPRSDGGRDQHDTEQHEVPGPCATGVVVAHGGPGGVHGPPVWSNRSRIGRHATSVTAGGPVITRTGEPDSSPSHGRSRSVTRVPIQKVVTTPFLPQRQASELPPPPPLPVAAPGERQHSAVLAALAAQSSPREHLRPVSGWGRLVAALLEPILMVVTLGVGWLIWAVIISGGGQTPAKQVMRHRVVLYGTAATGRIRPHVLHALPVRRLHRLVRVLAHLRHHHVHAVLGPGEPERLGSRPNTQVVRA